jgi:hypothetical protein
LRKPTKAMLFDPVERATHQIIYDRTDRSSVDGALGGAVLATPICVAGLARWTAYARAGPAASAGLGLRVIPDGTESIFAGPVLLVSKRGLYEYDVDLDLLWPTFDFWWTAENDQTKFKLGRPYVSSRFARR